MIDSWNYVCVFESDALRSDGLVQIFLKMIKYLKI